MPWLCESASGKTSSSVTYLKFQFMSRDRSYHCERSSLDIVSLPFQRRGGRDGGGGCRAEFSTSVMPSARCRERPSSKFTMAETFGLGKGGCCGLTLIVGVIYSARIIY